MGNCIHLILSPSKLQKFNCSSSSRSRKQEFGDMRSGSAKVHPDNGDHEVKAPALPKDANPISPPIPPIMPTDQSVSKLRTVKIVVTKKQLHTLLKNVKDLQAAGTAVHFEDRLLEKSISPRCRWRPSLDTIAE